MEAELLVADWHDPGQRVCDLWVCVSLEEVGRAKVVVPHLGAGGHACSLDLELGRDLGGVVIGAFEAALELVELAANGGYRKVLGGETHSCMHFVDFVFDHLVLLEFWRSVSAGTRIYLLAQATIPGEGGWALALLQAEPGGRCPHHGRRARFAGLGP